MREIKFRAWHIKDKKMLGHKDACLTPLFTPSFQYRNGETVLMQFTGLQDKSGKDIYEGDILEIRIQGDKQTCPYVVEDMCVLYNDNNRDDMYYQISSMCIVGNIHENPELLECK